MKKILFAMFVAVATMIGFTSCSSDSDSDTIYVFNGSTDNNAEGQPNTKFTLNLNATQNTFDFSITTNALTDNPSVDNYSGAFSANAEALTLTYSDGTTDVLTADVNITEKGLNKVKELTYDLGEDGTVKLKKK